jgi:hypothetical protein
MVLPEAKIMKSSRNHQFLLCFFPIWAGVVPLPDGEEVCAGQAFDFAHPHMSDNNQ